MTLELLAFASLALPLLVMVLIFGWEMYQSRKVTLRQRQKESSRASESSKHEDFE